MTNRASDATTMQIGELAERVNLSLRTIRHYDEVGLLKPSGRSEGGFRLYTQSDLDRLILIRQLRPLEFSLEEVGEIVSLLAEHSTGALTGTGRARLGHFLVQATERRARLADYLSRADEVLALLGDL